MYISNVMINLIVSIIHRWKGRKVIEHIWQPKSKSANSVQGEMQANKTSMFNRLAFIVNSVLNNVLISNLPLELKGYVALVRNIWD